MNPREKMMDRIRADGFNPDDFQCEYTPPPDGRRSAQLINCTFDELPDDVQSFVAFSDNTAIDGYRYEKGADPEITTDSEL